MSIPPPVCTIAAARARYAYYASPPLGRSKSSLASHWRRTPQPARHALSARPHAVLYSIRPFVPSLGVTPAPVDDISCRKFRNSSPKGRRREPGWVYSRLRTPKTNNTDLAIESNTAQVKVGEKLRKNSSLSKFNETTGPNRISFRDGEPPERRAAVRRRG